MSFVWSFAFGFFQVQFYVPHASLEFRDNLELLVHLRVLPCLVLGGGQGSLYAMQTLSRAQLQVCVFHYAFLTGTVCCCRHGCGDQIRVFLFPSDTANPSCFMERGSTWKPFSPCCVALVPLSACRPTSLSGGLQPLLLTTLFAVKISCWASVCKITRFLPKSAQNFQSYHCSQG